MMMNPMMQNMTPSMMAPVGAVSAGDVGNQYGGYSIPHDLAMDRLMKDPMYAGTPMDFNDPSIAGYPIPFEDFTDVPVGPSGLLSFDAIKQKDPFSTIREGEIHSMALQNPDYGQFARAKMMDPTSVIRESEYTDQPSQRMTMTTSPRTPFNKEGFNSGLQLMNMGLGLLD